MVGGIFLTFLAAKTAPAQPRQTYDPPDSRAGQPAPALNVSLIRPEAGVSADWGSLRGKVVVLDFWATWCAPCVAVFPAFNKLEARFAGKPVVFLSITDEPAPTVRAFLGRTSLAGWIGIDRDQATFRAFEITSRPTAVVVDASGNLLGWTSPHTLALHPEIIEGILEGRDMSARLSPTPHSTGPNAFAVFDDETGPQESAPDAKPLCHILIRPARESASHALRFQTTREFTREGQTIRDLIAVAYEVPLPYIAAETPLADAPKYDLLFRWPTAPSEVGYSLLQKSVAATFGLEISRQRRETDVYLLTIDASRAEKLEQGVPGVAFDPETGKYAINEDVLAQQKAGKSFFFAKGGGNALAANLSYCLKKPVLDETNLNGTYEFVVPFDYDTGTPEALIRDLVAAYPITITPARRTVEMVVVRKSEAPG